MAADLHGPFVTRSICPVLQPHRQKWRQVYRRWEQSFVSGAVHPIFLCLGPLIMLTPHRYQPGRGQRSWVGVSHSPALGFPDRSCDQRHSHGVAHPLCFSRDLRPNPAPVTVVHRLLSNIFCGLWYIEGLNRKLALTITVVELQFTRGREGRKEWSQVSEVKLLQASRSFPGARGILDSSEQRVHSCISNVPVIPSCLESSLSDLALLSPSYGSVSNFLGRRVWRIHAHLWHETKNTSLGLTARDEDVVRGTLAVKDPGVPVWEAIPRPPFLGTGENRKGGKTNSDLGEGKMQRQLPQVPYCSLLRRQLSLAGWRSSCCHGYYLFVLEKISALTGGWIQWQTPMVLCSKKVGFRS